LDILSALDSESKTPIGNKFKWTPHVDQSSMFDTVIQRLYEGGSVGIFPEGGSHDRCDFLPLKPGCAMVCINLQNLSNVNFSM
jgi:glycerol-3-phosphate O-acyltransferase / dihydroxyacetone phosphate acyltransferase